jgi:hypothetical protein
MDVNKIIDEEIIKQLIEEYPSSFDMDHFKSLLSFRKRKEYCDEHLPLIGSGTGRRVYVIDNDRVLKLANNKKGVAQNEVEIAQSNDYMVDDLVAKTYDHHPDALWVEAERCKKLTKSRFKQIVGVSFDEFSDIITYEWFRILNPRRIPINKPDRYEELLDDENYPFIYKIADYIGNYELPIGDLTRISTYGENSDGDVIVVDYGLTGDVLGKYYS